MQQLQVNNDFVDVVEIGIPIIYTHNTVDTDTTNTTTGTAPTGNLHVAVQGCAHGALDCIYETLQLYEQKKGEETKTLTITKNHSSIY